METDYLTRHYQCVRSRVERRYPLLIADDVVQQTYCEVFTYLGNTGAKVEEPRALLWTIAKRVAVRSMQNKHRMISNSDVMEDLAAPTREPWELASAREVRERISSAARCGETPGDGLLVQHYVDGRSCRELAQQHGSTKDAVKSRLYRARQDLRWELGDESP